MSAEEEVRLLRSLDEQFVISMPTKASRSTKFASRSAHGVQGNLLAASLILRCNKETARRADRVRDPRALETR